MCHTDYEFIHRMTRNLFGGIPAEAINHGFSQRRPIRSVQIPPELGKSPTDFTNIHRFFLGRFFCHADFADDADFFSWDFFHRMTRSLFGGIPAEAINHGFSQRRPIRSVQIPPELGKSPTDFTNIHRFFLGRFFCHADFADDADFFHRMTRNLFGDFLMRQLLTDFHGGDLSGRCRYPPEVGKSPTKKNLCISVKSVGRNNLHKEKSASSAKSA